MSDTLRQDRKEKPSNWDDVDGWNQYYDGVHQAQSHLSKIDLGSGWRDAEHFLGAIVQSQWRKIWFPGCGVTIGPRVFAALGFNVWASDVSHVAIAIQRDLQNLPITDLIAIDDVRTQYQTEEHGLQSTDGALHLSVHDFRSRFAESQFDCALNTRSFQGLPLPSMKAAARVHYDALRAGGHAIFSTVNVQGQLRDILEDALLEAGFTIPLNESERWYRKTLAATRIPHFFILGQPMVDPRGERYSGSADKQQQAEDRETLASFRDEYHARRQREAEATSHLFADGETKIAHVVYNTG